MNLNLGECLAAIKSMVATGDFVYLEEMDVPKTSIDDFFLKNKCLLISNEETSYSSSGSTAIIYGTYHGISSGNFAATFEKNDQQFWSLVNLQKLTEKRVEEKMRGSVLLIGGAVLLGLTAVALLVDRKK